MATKKDLVEAYSFSRRRLVTAFVSGAPGGREVEPARPGRMIVGGVALAVLLIAGAAVAGALSDRADVDWKEPGLVSDSRGALYVILDEGAVPGEPALRPVINVTSAQLILGPDIETRTVPDDEIAGQPKGPPIGILNAPATVPPADDLIGSGWTSCTGTGLGMKTDIATSRLVEPGAGLGFVVSGATSGETYLIAEAEVPGLPVRAYRYRLPADNDELYTDLHVSPLDEVTVPDRWLELFPPGGPLTNEGLGIEEWGTPVTAGGYPEGTRVGDYFESSGTTFAVTGDRVVQLTPFAAAVLRRTPMGGGRTARAIDAPAGYDIDPSTPYADAHWPQDVMTGSPSATDQVCGLLETAEGEGPAARLAVAPSGSASAEGLADGEVDVSVASGHGALVRSADWITATGGTRHLVDDRGYSYPVAGAEEVHQLGWDDVAEVVVPDVWTKLFQIGPELSIDAALCPPVPTEQCA